MFGQSTPFQKAFFTLVFSGLNGKLLQLLCFKEFCNLTEIQVFGTLVNKS